MLQFVHPWMLIALAAVGLPVVIHWLTRARPRPIRFPTYHLLVESTGGLQAMHRLRTLLVLALRTLLVAALAMVFAQPFLAARQATATEEAQRRVAVVVDASLSMSASQAGLPLFNHASGQAADVLRSLDKGSVAAVVFIGAQPRSVLPSVSRNLAVLHESLAQAQPTLEKGDAAAAVALAAKLLDGAGEVHVFSDFQRTNWATVDLRRHDAVRFALHPVTTSAVANVGVTQLQLSPANPVRGETVELTCTVFNATPAKRVESALLDLEGISLRQDIELQPFSSGSTVFSFSMPATGIHPGRVSLEPDDLQHDNTRHFRLAVSDALKVLLISDADATDPQTGAFFIHKALAPSADTASGITVTRRLAQDVDRTSLETADVFVLASPCTLMGESTQAIARRVRDGAAMLCFLDGPTAPTIADALAAASEGTLSKPFDLVRPILATDAGVGFAQALAPQGPLRIFDSPDQGTLAAWRVRRYYHTQINQARRDEVLARFADGSVALSRSPAGLGVAVFANFSPAPQVSNLAGSALFPVLMHELLRDLRRAGDGREQTPGMPWQIDVTDPSGTSDDAVYAVRSPVSTLADTQIVSRGRTIRLATAPATTPGIYHVQRADQTVDLAVVNTDADETDTRMLVLDDLLTGSSARVQVAGAADAAEAGADRKPWWPSMLTLAAAALLGEMTVLAFWRRKPLHAQAGAGGGES